MCLRSMWRRKIYRRNNNFEAGFNFVCFVVAMTTTLMTVNCALLITNSCIHVHGPTHRHSAIASNLLLVLTIFVLYLFYLLFGVQRFGGWDGMCVWLVD